MRLRRGSLADWATSAGGIVSSAARPSSQGADFPIGLSGHADTL